MTKKKTVQKECTPKACSAENEVIRLQARGFTLVQQIEQVANQANGFIEQCRKELADINQRIFELTPAPATQEVSNGSAA